MATESPTPTDHEKFGRDLVEAAWNDGDLDRVEELCATDMVVHNPSNPTGSTGPSGYNRSASRVTILITRNLNGPIPRNTFAATVDGAGEVQRDLNDEGVSIRWSKSHARIQSDGAIIETSCHYRAEDESAIHESREPVGKRTEYHTEKLING